MRWTVRFSGAAAKATGKLPERVQHALAALTAEVAVLGPALHGRGWRHFGKLKGRTDEYHCHLKAGRPTYVACWRIVDRSERIVELYYVGTHENAPY